MSAKTLIAKAISSARGYLRRVSDEAILAALMAFVVKFGRGATTGQIGDAPTVLMSKQGLLPRLEQLEAAGKIRRVPHVEGSLFGWVPAEVSIPLPPPPPPRKVAQSTVAELVAEVRRLVERGVTATCVLLADVLGWSRVWVRAVVGAAVAVGQLFRGGARNAEVYPVPEAAVEATAAVAARRGFGATAKDAARWLLARARQAMPEITLTGFARIVASCKSRVTSASPFGSLLDARTAIAAGVCQ